MMLSRHVLEKLGIRICWNIGPISWNGEEEYGPRFVDFMNFFSKPKNSLIIRGFWNNNNKS